MSLAAAIVLGNKIAGGAKQVGGQGKNIFKKLEKYHTNKDKAIIKNQSSKMKQPSAPSAPKTPKAPEPDPAKVDAMLNNVMSGKLPGNAVKPIGGPVTNPSLKVNSNQVKKLMKKNTDSVIKSPVLSTQGKLAKLGFGK